MKCWPDSIRFWCWEARRPAFVVQVRRKTGRQLVPKIHFRSNQKRIRSLDLWPLWGSAGGRLKPLKSPLGEPVHQGWLEDSEAFCLNPPPLALKPFRGTAWSHLPAIDFYSSQKQNLWLATQHLVSHARSTMSCSELRAIRLLFDRIGRFSGSKDISQQRSEIRPLRPKSLLVIKPIEWDTWIYHDLVQICFGWIDLSCLSLGAIWVGNFVRMDWINRCALFESLKPLNAPKGSKTVWNSELKTSEFITCSWSSLHL